MCSIKINKYKYILLQQAYRAAAKLRKQKGIVVYIG